jgi:coenzyme F420-reducing hydrogenase delta subunit
MNSSRIVLIGCQHSAGEAVAELAAQGQPLPEGVEWVSVPCGGSVDELTILRAFEAGAAQVVVIACCEGACRSLVGNRWAEKRVAAARALLAEVGIAPERLTFRNLAPSQAVDLAISLQPSAVSALPTAES